MPGLNTLKWWDGQKWRPDFADVNAVAEPANSSKLATTLTLSVPASRNDTGSITLTATLKAGSTLLSSKAIVFQELVGSTWTNIGASVNTNGSGVSTTTYTLNATTQFRATFAGDASYVNSTSSTQTCQLKVLSVVTQRFEANWSATYKSDNTKYTAEDPAILQSYTTRSAAYNNYRALIGFDDAAIRNFLAEVVTKTKVNISIRVASMGSSFTSGAMLLGWHDYDTEPATVDMTRVDEALVEQSVSFLEVPGRILTTLETTVAEDWIDAFIASDAKGVSLGPAPSTALKYVIYAAGADATNKPWIEFTIEKYV